MGSSPSQYDPLRRVFFFQRARHDGVAMPEPTSSPALEDLEYLREQVRAARERLLIERLRPRYWLARMVVAVS